MFRVSTPPKHATPAVMAPFIVVVAGVRNPDSDPASRYRCGWNSAKVTAAVPPWEAPTIACPPGARPLLAASQSGSSSDRKVSHCLPPPGSLQCRDSRPHQPVPPPKHPCRAKVFIALPVVTQLLTSVASSTCFPCSRAGSTTGS
jgi:hypothetical protein